MVIIKLAQDYSTLGALRVRMLGFSSPLVRLKLVDIPNPKHTYLRLSVVLNNSNSHSQWSHANTISESKLLGPYLWPMVLVQGNHALATLIDPLQRSKYGPQTHAPKPRPMCQTQEKREPRKLMKWVGSQVPGPPLQRGALILPPGAVRWQWGCGDQFWGSFWGSLEELFLPNSQPFFKGVLLITKSLNTSLIPQLQLEKKKKKTN